MIHNEHLRKADELYEIRHDSQGNAIHVYITDGEATIFGSLHDLINYVYFGDPNVKCYYLQESMLSALYERPEYNFNKLERVISLLDSRNREYKRNSKLEKLEFTYDKRDMVIAFIVDAPDFWFSACGFDIHYCEDYNQICVYLEGRMTSIYSRKIDDNGK